MSTLRRFRALDWTASFSYAPPTVEVVLDVDSILSAVEIDRTRTRCMEPTMRVTMSVGVMYEIVGKPEDLLCSEDPIA